MSNFWTRMDENKEKRQVPVAPAVTVRQITIKNPEADTNTDQRRFKQAILDANEFSKKWDRDVIVFKSPQGFYFIRELFLTEPAIEQLYVALKKFNCTEKRRKQIAWRRTDINRVDFIPRKNRDYNDNSK